MPAPYACCSAGKSKHRHVFIYYQRPDVPNDQGELVDAKGRGMKGSVLEALWSVFGFYRSCVRDGCFERV